MLKITIFKPSLQDDCASSSIFFFEVNYLMDKVDIV